MQKIKLQDAECGMKLTQDVTTTTGQILIPEGAEISDRILMALENRGVSHVCVEGEEVKVREVFSEEEIKGCEDEIREDVIGSGEEHPLMKVIVDCCVDRELKRRMAAKAGDAVSVVTKKLETL